MAFRPCCMAPGRARCRKSNAKKADERLALEDLRKATKVVALTLLDMLSVEPQPADNH